MSSTNRAQWPAEEAQARAIVNALGAGWALRNESRDPDNNWQAWQARRLADGLAIAFSWPEAYGAAKLKPARLEIRGVWPVGHDGQVRTVRTPYGESSATTSITVDVSKPADAIARTILNRLILPSNGFERVYLEACRLIASASQIADQQAAAVARILLAEPGSSVSRNSGPYTIYLGATSHAYTLRVDSDSIRFEPFSVPIDMALTILQALRKAPPALIHAFSTGRVATALCGSSNRDDGDAPASEDLSEVTCADCRRLIQERHAAEDPDCTCNDCIAAIAGGSGVSLERGDVGDWDRFDICEAYAVLEWDYHAGGWLRERPSNVRRGRARGYVGEATSVQLARLQFKPRPDLSYDTLTENGQAIYTAAVNRWRLQVPSLQKGSL